MYWLLIMIAPFHKQRPNIEEETIQQIQRLLSVSSIGKMDRACKPHSKNDTGKPISRNIIPGRLANFN